MSISAPAFFYGTAWKEEATADLTFKALKNGFRAIDTANQRKHYYEKAVGEGIKKYLELKTLTRDELFLQTKFTYARGQDHRKPYNETDSFTKQVADSFASSLVNLGTNTIDSYVLHGPSSGQGITDVDLETWQAMESLVDKKQVRFLGVSNISAPQLGELCKKVKIKPSFVQNRCFARSSWDRDVREICQVHKVKYQGFSLLTANARELSSPAAAIIAKKHSKTVAQVVFRFCQQMGMICLTGTSNETHMKEDLANQRFSLSMTELTDIENIAF